MDDANAAPVAFITVALHPMFTTEPQDEFAFAKILSASATRHWRMVELAMHVPWFVLTVEVFDNEASFKRTLCVAWDTDLVETIESLGAAKAIAVLCMVPGWCSANGQWSARVVSEVWRARTDSGDLVALFRDERGFEFGDRRGVAQGQPLRDRHLVLKLDCPMSAEPPASPTNEPTRHSAGWRK
jgi:hypothetical protein